MLRLKCIGKNGELGNGLLLQHLVRKLPEEMVVMWERHRRVSGLDEGVTALKEWVEQEAEIRRVASEAVYGLNGLAMSNKRKLSNDHQKNAFVSNTNHGGDKKANEEIPLMRNKTGNCWMFESGQCRFGAACRYRHPEVCRNFLEGKCRVTNCRFLHRRIDRTDERSRVETKKKDGGFTMTTATGPVTGRDEGEYVALRTVRVWVSNGQKSVAANFLLDDASTETFVNQALADELGLHGQSEKIKVQVLGGSSKEFSVERVQFRVSDERRRAENELSALVVGSVIGALEITDWSEVKSRWEHLKRIRFPTLGKRKRASRYLSGQRAAPRSG